MINLYIIMKALQSIMLNMTVWGKVTCKIYQYKNTLKKLKKHLKNIIINLGELRNLYKSQLNIRSNFVSSKDWNVETEMFIYSKNVIIMSGDINEVISILHNLFLE